MTPNSIATQLLNVEEAILPQYLYRIIPLERFIEALSTNLNSLVSPEVWTDPYEAAQLRTELEVPMYVIKGGGCSTKPPDDMPHKVGGIARTSTRVLTRIFCQCWSDLPESDAMWRLYSPTSAGVKLKVQSACLLESLISGAGEGCPFLGAVEYLPQSDLETLIQDAQTNFFIQRCPDLFQKRRGEAWAKYVLRKRQPYIHESEYRLILCHVEPNGQNGSTSLFNYAFDFKALVNQIELDPKTEDPDSLERTIRTIGFTGEVRRSRLYEPPNFNIRTTWPKQLKWINGTGNPSRNN